VIQITPTISLKSGSLFVRTKFVFKNEFYTFWLLLTENSEFGGMATERSGWTWNGKETLLGFGWEIDPSR
jgi:hypothetical protein